MSFVSKQLIDITLEQVILCWQKSINVQEYTYMVKLLIFLACIVIVFVIEFQDSFSSFESKSTVEIFLCYNCNFWLIEFLTSGSLLTDQPSTI